MKNLSKFLVGAACVTALAFSTGAFIKVYAAEAPAATPGQPVDLTYAAEKALPAVVHIKYVQNSKTQMTHLVDFLTHLVSLEILTKVMVHVVNRFRRLRRRLQVAVLSFHLMVIS